MLFLLAALAASELMDCSDAKPEERMCVANDDCNLDEVGIFNCTVFPSIRCQGERTFPKEIKCRYCYQSPTYFCDPATLCDPGDKNVITRCFSTEPCIGSNPYQRQAKCARSRLSQKTAILLSLFLGAFGADRLYLGHIATGIFKLLTVGGLGIAYMIDLVLIVCGYLGPADGSMFPERL